MENIIYKAAQDCVNLEVCSIKLSEEGFLWKGTWDEVIATDVRDDGYHAFKKKYSFLRERDFFMDLSKTSFEKKLTRSGNDLSCTLSHSYFWDEDDELGYYLRAHDYTFHPIYIIGGKEYVCAFKDSNGSYCFQELESFIEDSLKDFSMRR